MESKRRLEVPERRLHGFLDGGCLKDTSRELHINFQISTLLGSAPSPMCLQSVIMESKRRLEVAERSLGGFEMVDALRTHPGTFISNFKSLPCWKVV